jgi:hypothetical protein
MDKLFIGRSWPTRAVQTYLAIHANQRQSVPRSAAEGIRVRFTVEGPRAETRRKPHYRKLMAEADRHASTLRSRIAKRSWCFAEAPIHGHRFHPAQIQRLTVNV